MIFNTIYISVKNMKRALDFYQKFFQKEPEEKDERFSYFDLNGITFGLYNPAVDKAKINWGENVVPCFQVKDIEKEFERIKKIARLVDDKIKKYGGYKLFQFKDTEGNLVEVYSVE